MILRSKRIRESRRLRLVDVAALARCSTDTVVRLDRGDVEGMSVATLLRLADALRTPATELLPALGLRIPPRNVAGSPVKRAHPKAPTTCEQDFDV